MAQGAVKKAPKASSGSGASSKPARKSTTLGPRPGKKVIAPKKADLVRQQKLKKKVTSGLINATERALAAKAGHLELLKGGKKDKKEEEAKGKGK